MSIVLKLSMRSKKNPPILIGAFFLLACSTAISGEPLYAGAPLSIRKTIDEEQGLGLKEILVMGPTSSAFWAKVQKIISNDDYIMNFALLAELLELQFEEPVDAVSPEKPGYRSRRDATEKTLRIKTMGYGVVQNAENPKARDVALAIDLDLNQICIAAAEVERVFGKGRIAITPHEIGVAKTNGGPIETNYSVAYPRESMKAGIPPLVFSYAYSGCVKSISMHKMLPN
jgi:hypothetical protein